MKRQLILAVALVALLVSACAPGVGYVPDETLGAGPGFVWDTSGRLPQPAPVDPDITIPGPGDGPIITVPEDQTPPSEPPVEPPVEDACKVKELPEPAPIDTITKCPGERPILDPHPGRRP